MEWKDGVLVGGDAHERSEEFEKAFVSLVGQMLTHDFSSGRLISLIEAIVEERRQVRLS